MKSIHLSKIIGRNFKTLRLKAGLTSKGIAFALKISISYVLMIERGGANLSQEKLESICNFFDIPVSLFVSEKLPKLDLSRKKGLISSFYIQNKHNHDFFIERKKEYKVATFLKDVLLSDGIFNEERSVKEIITYSKGKFARVLKSQEVSRELRRLYEKGVLARRKKYESSTSYLYRKLE